MNRKQLADVIENALNDLVFYPTWEECLAVADAVIAAQGDEDATFHVRKDAPDTSKAVSEKIRQGTLQAQILGAMVSKGSMFGGATDDELERLLGRSHQSVSGARNTLVRKGYVVDSGERRKNSHGNMAIVWYYTGKEVQS